MEEIVGTMEKCYRQFQGIVPLVESVHNIAETAIDGKENVYNPFPSSYDVRRIVKDARRSCIDMVVHDFQREMPNVPMDANDVEKFLDENEGAFTFDVELIKEYLRARYEDEAQKLSMTAILAEALKMMPHKWDLNGHEEVKVSDILKNGRTIKLRFAYDPFSYGTFHPYDGITKLAAFEKLVWMVLRDENPITVRSYNLSGVYWNLETEKALEKQYPVSPFVEFMKLYKNCKIDIKFKDSKDARKVAERLVEENKSLAGL